MLNPLHIFPTLYSSLSLLLFNISVVTTTASVIRTCFVFAKWRGGEGAVGCLFIFWFRIPVCGENRISEFVLKQPFLSSPRLLVKSHRKGNCTNNHYLSYHKSSLWPTKLNLQLSIKVSLSPCRRDIVQQKLLLILLLLMLIFYVICFLP